jgi:hypothetical protein
MIRLPLTKTAGVISTVSNAITHPIGQATLAAAPIAAAAIPLAVEHHAEKKRENALKTAIAPLLAAGVGMVGRALAKPGVQTAMNLAPMAMAMAPTRAPTPQPSPARSASNNIAQPSTAFTPPASQAPTQPKLSSVATTPEGVIDNRQMVQPSLPTVGPAGNATPGGKSQDGSSPGVRSTSTPKPAKPKMTTSPGAPKAFKAAWFLPFQGVTNTVKDFGLGAVDAIDGEAAKLLAPSDQLDPVKNRTPPLGHII